MSSETAERTFGPSPAGLRFDPEHAPAVAFAPLALAEIGHVPDHPVVGHPDLERARGVLFVAAAAVEHDLRGLFSKSSGNQVYGTEAHREHQTAAITKLHTAVDATTAVAGTVQRDAGALVERLRHVDHLRSLSTSEAQRAGTYSSFVAEDCRDLPLAEVALKVRLVAEAPRYDAGHPEVDHWDAPIAVCFERYAGRRLALEQERLAGQALALPPDADGRIRYQTAGIPPEDLAALRSLEGALATLRRRLVDPQVAAAITEAQRDLAAAAALKAWAVQVRRSVDGSEHRALAASRMENRQRMSGGPGSTLDAWHDAGVGPAGSLSDPLFAQKRAEHQEATEAQRTGAAPIGPGLRLSERPLPADSGEAP